MRSGWKIASVFILYLVLRIVFGTVMQALPINEGTNLPLLLYAGEVALIVAVLVGVKWLDEASPRHIGLISLRRGFRDCSAGFLFAAAAMTIVFLVLLSFGRISVANGLAEPRFSHVLWSGLLLYIAVGFAEEMFFRGYCMTVLRQTGRTWIAVLVSSALFSVAHGINPNVSVIGLMNIFLVGLLLAFMFVKTGNLWMPIGFHIAWNFFQGNIFGFPVSGTEPHGMYHVEDVKGVLWSGGAFGPEGGLLVTMLLMVGLLFVWRYPKHQKKN